MITYIDLAALPAGHALRARPLAEIRAEIRNRVAGGWRAVTPAWGIARCAYNDLEGTPWHDLNEWRAPATP